MSETGINRIGYAWIISYIIGSIFLVIICLKEKWIAFSENVIKMTQEKTISFIVENQICTGCGNCIALCPKEAISFNMDKGKGILSPKINIKKCNQCGICKLICPGHEVNFPQMNIDLFGKTAQDFLIGNYKYIYAGYSNNLELRYCASSGGLLTQLLLFALKQNLIAGAIVVRMNKNNPLVSESFIARTEQEIIDAMGSKYLLTPTNIALRRILNEIDDKERYAFVGLPCHIHGLRKAQEYYPILKQKIAFCLGLFCGSCYNLNVIEFLLDNIGIKQNDIECIYFRGSGWPGIMKIIDKKGAIFQIPYIKYSSNIGSAFFPLRCTLCIDALNEFADISFGDAWLKEYLNDLIGTSICIIRTPIGLDLFSKLKNEGNISYSLISREKLLESQNSLLRYKKHNQRNHRMFCSRFIGMKLPEYHLEFYNNTPLTLNSIISSFDLYCQIFMGNHRFLWPFHRIIAKIRTSRYNK